MSLTFHHILFELIPILEGIDYIFEGEFDSRKYVEYMTVSKNIIDDELRKQNYNHFVIIDGSSGYIHIYINDKDYTEELFNKIMKLINKYNLKI
jgi:hypothetical protein